jgi:hypothetical protein
MTLTASDVASLTSRIDRWEYAEYVCTALVAAACFGEYIADFTEWWKRDPLWKWFGTLEHRKDSVAKFSTLVLIAALAGELLCVVRTNQLSGTLVGDLGDRAEEAYLKSREAISNSATAVSQASAAVQQSSTAVEESTEATAAASSALTIAHGASQEATRFRIEAAEAQAKLGATVKREILPRSVNPDAIVRLSKFPKASASVLYKSGDGEANTFANDVRNGLLKAGWDIPDEVKAVSANPLVSRDDTLMGIRVYTHDEWLDFTHVRIPKGKDTRDMALVALLTNGFGGWQSTRLNGLPGNNFIIVIGQRHPEIGEPRPGLTEPSRK